MSTTLTLGRSRYAEDFVEVDMIGSGGFGAVFRAVSRVDDAVYAVKKILLRAATRARDQARDEVKLLAKISNHPHIVRYHTAWTEPIDAATVAELVPPLDDTYYYADAGDAGPAGASEYSEVMFVVQELCGARSLRDWLDDPARSVDDDYDVGLELAAQLISALHHVHSHGVAHRDLKPSNVFLLDDGETLKLGDFGLATEVDASDLVGGIGSVLYAAPEQADPDSTFPYSGSTAKAADVYSLGLVLLEMFSPPCTTVMERVTTIKAAKAGRFPPTLDPFVRGLIGSMLSPNPSDRPSSAALFSHPLFALCSPSLALSCSRVRPRSRSRSSSSPTPSDSDISMASPSSPLPSPLASPLPSPHPSPLSSPSSSPLASSHPRQASPFSSHPSSPSHPVSPHARIAQLEAFIRALGVAPPPP